LIGDARYGDISDGADEIARLLNGTYNWCPYRPRWNGLTGGTSGGAGIKIYIWRRRGAAEGEKPQR